MSDWNNPKLWGRNVYDKKTGKWRWFSMDKLKKLGKW